MPTISLTPDMAAARPELRQPWSRPTNRYALTIAVAVHLILLAAVLLLRTQAPTPPKPELTELTLYLPKPPQVVPEPLPPPPKATVPPAPSLPNPEPPPLIIEPKVEPAPPQAPHP